MLGNNGSAAASGELAAPRAASVKKEGPFPLVAFLDKHNPILTIGWLHSSTQEKRLSSAISMATPNPLKETIQQRVEVLYKKTLICSNQLPSQEGVETTQFNDPFDCAYDLDDLDYPLQFVRIFLTELKRELDFRKNNKNYPELKKALAGGLDIIINADCNLGRPGKDEITPFLHKSVQLEALLKGILDIEIGSIKRLLVSATDEAVKASQAMCKLDEHGYACDKGPNEVKLFKKIYGETVEQIEARKNTVDEGHDVSLTRAASKKSSQCLDAEMPANHSKAASQQFAVRVEVPDEGAERDSKRIRSNSAAAKTGAQAGTGQPVLRDSAKAGFSDRQEDDDNKAVFLASIKPIVAQTGDESTMFSLLDAPPNAGSCHCLTVLCCRCRCDDSGSKRKVGDMSQATHGFPMKR